MGTSSHPLELLIEDVANFLQVVDINDHATHEMYRTGHEFMRLVRVHMELDKKRHDIQFIQNCWSKN